MLLLDWKETGNQELPEDIEALAVEICGHDPRSTTNV
jgi:hypothetical protein